MTMLICFSARTERVPADRGLFDFWACTKQLFPHHSMMPLPYLESSDDCSKPSLRLCGRPRRQGAVPAQRLRVLGMPHRLRSLRRLLDAGICIGGGCRTTRTSRPMVLKERLFAWLMTGNTGLDDEDQLLFHMSGSQF